MPFSNQASKRVPLAVLLAALMVISGLAAVPMAGLAAQPSPTRPATFSEVRDRPFDSDGDGLNDTIMVRYTVNTYAPSAQVMVRFKAYNATNYLWSDQTDSFMAYSRMTRTTAMRSFGATRAPTMLTRRRSADTS